MKPIDFDNLKYVNLASHTHYSMPLGVGTVSDHIKKAMASGHTGFAITDSMMMGGVLETYNTCSSKKIPLALGVQLNIIDDLERKDKVNKFFTVTCFAKNKKGYENLVYLTSIGSTPDHFYFKPRVSLMELIENSEGLVILSGDIKGMISQSILKETNQEEILVQIFKEHFKENFYLEYHIHSLKQQWNGESKQYEDVELDPQEIVNKRLLELGKKYDIKGVIVQNSFMPDKSDKTLQDILIGNTPMGRDGWKFSNAHYIMTPKEMYDLMMKTSSYLQPHFEEFCANTIEVLDKTKDLKLEFKPELPTIQYNEFLVNKEEKFEKIFLDTKEKIKDLSPGLYDLMTLSDNDISLRTAIKILIKNEKIDFTSKIELDRLDYEIRTIQRNGIIKLMDYFLLLEDVTHFVIDSGFQRGFGRGCFKGDTLVLTTDGMKKISEIKAGDTVWTHEGQEKKVIKTFEYDVQEKGLEVFTDNSFQDSIALTKDHKVYGKKAKSKKIEFRPISEFERDDELFIPLLKSLTKELNLIENFDDRDYLDNESAMNIRINLMQKNVPSYKKSYGDKCRVITQMEEALFVPEKGHFVLIQKLNEVELTKVYDLMVEDTPSFVTANFAAHNSGAGSLLAYGLNITDCQPLKFDLLFERFLTRERVGQMFFETKEFPMKEVLKK